MTLLRRRIWLVGLLILSLLVGGIYGFRSDKIKNPQERTGRASPLTRALWLLSGIETAPLVIRVVDTTTMQGVPGAGCVIPETNQRIETDAKGISPVIRAPVLRNPRQDELVAELAGELAVICYKNGYRDAITTGLRMYEDTATQFEVRMTPYGPRDKRIGPTLRHVPPHQLWQTALVDRFRLYDEGQGKESPDLTRPGNMVVPPRMIGEGLQTPIQPGPPGQTFIRPGAGVPPVQPQAPAPGAQPQQGVAPAPGAVPTPGAQPQRGSAPAPGAQPGQGSAPAPAQPR